MYKFMLNRAVVWIGSSRKDLRKFPRGESGATSVKLYIPPNRAKLIPRPSHSESKEMDLIRQRLMEAERFTKKGKIDVTTKVKRPVKAESSSGNVFADLGLPHPEQELLKAKLTMQIYRLVKKRGLTQTEAGGILGIKQPHVSLLMRNRAGSFSVARFIEFLTALGQDVEITVRPSRKEHGEMSVTQSRS